MDSFKLVSFSSRGFCQSYKQAVFSCLCRLMSEYPCFYSWYNEKVIPGTRTSEREIILALFENNIVGLSIIKNAEEKKICTLSVDKRYRHNGVGKMLFEKSFELLNTSEPIITVSSTRHEQFKKNIGIL